MRILLSTRGRRLALGQAALAAALWLVPPAQAASTLGLSATASGSVDHFNLSGQLAVPDADRGRTGQVFVVALLPDSSVYALSGGRWTPVTGSAVPAYFSGALGDHALALLSDFDTTALGGTVVYAGYGGSLQAMLERRQFDRIYTVPGSPASLTPATDASLNAFFKDALGPNSRNYLGVDVIYATATGAPVPSPTPPTASTMSGTTLQENGVDEADSIKSDGVHVFDLTPATGVYGSTVGILRPIDTVTVNDTNVLRRQRLNADAADAALQPAGTLALPLSRGMRARDMYLDSERSQLAVLGAGSAYGDFYSYWFNPWWWSGGATEVVLVSAPASGELRTVRKLRFDANSIGTRRIGATLYLVLRSYPQIAGLDPWWSPDRVTANQTLINALQAAQLLPTLSIDDGAAQPLVQASQCLTQTQNAARSADIITLVAIDLSSTTHRHAARCFTGGTEAFYMSERSLYLATTRSTYTYSASFPVYSAQTSTDLHKFALNGLSIDYRGSGSVSGHLGFDQNRKSFRMGESNDTLRVITQNQTAWAGWSTPMVVTTVAASTTVASFTPATSTTTPDVRPTPAPESPGRLTILRENAGALVKVGELPNAARPQALGKPGEQLYATRFMGNRGYLVTYRLTDPLYVLDLSDPTDPKVAGELQVSGYSDYLFPLSENLLLGVGKDAISDSNGGDGRFAWYQGVKVSLIDVTNPTAPREAARTVIGKRGTDATVLHDHHGIALQSRGGVVRVGLPVSLHETPSAWGTGAPNDYYRFTRTELQRLEVNLGAQSLSARTPLPGRLSTERDISNDRSLLWNDQVHWFQNGLWSSSPW